MKNAFFSIVILLASFATHAVDCFDAVDLKTTTNLPSEICFSNLDLSPYIPSIFGRDPYIRLSGIGPKGPMDKKILGGEIVTWDDGKNPSHNVLFVMLNLFYAKEYNQGLRADIQLLMEPEGYGPIEVKSLRAVEGPKKDASPFEELYYGAVEVEYVKRTK